MKKIIAGIGIALTLLTPVVVLADEQAPAVPNDSALGRLERVRMKAGLKSEDPRTVVAGIINAAFGLLGAVVLAFYVYAGYMWMTAQGESEKVETAQKIIKETTIGLGILLASYAISRFVVNSLVGAVTT